MRREGVSRASEKKVPQLALKTLYGIFIRREKKIISRGPLTPVVSESFFLLLRSVHCRSLRVYGVAGVYIYL